MSDRIDVLGMGAVAVDDILFLSQFPRPDSKMPVLRRERHSGGLCGTALVAARRLGRTCAYAGCLGDDSLSRFILDGFAAEGVSLDHVIRRPGAVPFHSTIVVDTSQKTRTILYEEQGVVGADPSGPPEDVLRRASVLLVDHIGLEGMVRAARIARAAGTPVVADLERDGQPLVQTLLDLSDHLIVPVEFARGVTGKKDPGPAALALCREDRAVVVVTCGAAGSWYVSREEPGALFHQPAFRVEVVDTNGCGDVFHGAYAAGLSEGMGMGERVRLAAAVAALKATQPGGQNGIPTRARAEQFLEERRHEALRASG
ncbi:MAG TPA: PfkB family carbohydrate kinase [Spirochaetia bacterium]|nr:PfkB family carbohydrate kinase [Spirochaetia bacterium]